MASIDCIASSPEKRALAVNYHGGATRAHLCPGFMWHRPPNLSHCARKHLGPAPSFLAKANICNTNVGRVGTKRATSRMCSCLDSKSSIKPRLKWFGLVPTEGCPMQRSQNWPLWLNMEWHVKEVGTWQFSLATLHRQYTLGHEKSPFNLAIAWKWRQGGDCSDKVSAH